MLTPTVKMEFSAALTLSEDEVRTLNDLCGYYDSVAKAVHEHVTKTQIDHRKLQALLQRLGPETSRCVGKFDETRRVFNQP